MIRRLLELSRTLDELIALADAGVRAYGADPELVRLAQKAYAQVVAMVPAPNRVYPIRTSGKEPQMRQAGVVSEID